MWIGLLNQIVLIVDIRKKMHTFFICKKWTEGRHNLEGVVRPITLDNTFEKTKKQENWIEVVLYIEKVLRNKNQIETVSLFGKHFICNS